MGIQTTTCFCDIKIEGTTLKSPGLINEVTIIENNTFPVANAQMRLIDETGYIEKELAIQDGTKVQISLSTSREKAVPQDFVVFNTRFVRNQNSIILDCNLILDVPNYYAKSVRDAIDGSSSDAISEIAGKSGLEFDGDNTDDKQIWLGFGTAASYARSIADCGYVDDTSFMSLAVTADKKLLYKNITELMSKEADKIAYIGKGKEGDLRISESKFYNSAGLRNNWLAYGHYNFFNDVEGEFLENTSSEISKNEGYLQLNSAVKSDIEYSRIDSYEFDCGNVNKNYQKAKYQNLKNKALYSQSGALLVHARAIDLNLFDTVFVDMLDNIHGQNEHPDKSGKYVVFSKVRVLRGGTRYAERVDIMRNFVKEHGLSSLVA